MASDKDNGSDTAVGEQYSALQTPTVGEAASGGAEAGSVEKLEVELPNEHYQQHDEHKHEKFSGMLCFFLSAIGCAVGTGNVWRFSRIVALNAGDNGAGGFLIIWAMFLFLWSMPLIITEYAIGRISRKGVIGTFATLMGPRWAWMGAFILCVNIFILFYYSVVSGWVIWYAFSAILQPLPTTQAESVANWEYFERSYYPIVTHAIACVISAACCIKGVKTIEKVNTFMVPTLFFIVLGCFVRSLFLENALVGLRQFYSFDPSVFLKPQAWLDALTQNAFDTSAGWALFLTYANHIDKRTPVTSLGFLTPICNNFVSLLCGMTTFITTFGVLSSTHTNAEIMSIMRSSGPAGTGITFIWFPLLFEKIYLGRVLAVLFFSGLSFAAITSYIAVFNMATKVLSDVGVNQTMAVIITGVITFLMGLPSAISVEIFANQDFVWSSALVFCGLFIALAVIKFGPKRFREEGTSGPTLGRWFDIIICGIVPIEIAILIVWWLVSSITTNGDWWNPFGISSLMSCILQWCVVLVVALFANIVYVVYKERKAQVPEAQQI